MKVTFIVGVLCVCLCFGCTHGASHGHDHHEHEEAHANHIHDHDHDHDGGHAPMGEIVMSPEKAQAVGVKVDTLRPRAFGQVIHACGQILAAQGDERSVVAITSGVVHFSRPLVEGTSVKAGAALLHVSARSLQGGDASERARIDFEAAKSAYERAVKLNQQQIMSNKDFEAARQAYESAHLAYEAVRENMSSSGTTVVAPINGYVKDCLVKEGDYVEVGQTLMAVTQNRQLMLRVDVSERHAAHLRHIVTAHFRTPYNSQVYELAALNGKLLSCGKSANCFVPVTFAFDNRIDVLPGSFVEAYLIVGQEQPALVLPEEALVEEQGHYFVYIQLDEDCYRKQEVTVTGNDGCNVSIATGLSEGDVVVVHGAYHLKLASASNAIPAHSHHH